MDTDQTRENEIQVKRHSFAHLLAMAVLNLYKEAKLGIGAVIDNGFYQEIMLDRELGDQDLGLITKEMQRLIELELPFTQINISKNEAFDILHLQGQIFKTEILEQIPEDTVSFYKTGNEFFDLCKGPHVNHTGNLGSFKLTHIAKNHWNNDESRPILQRIYGVAFENDAEMQDFITHQQQIKEKDYLKTGEQIELFFIDPSQIIPILLPKGVALFEKLREQITRANIECGFKLIRSSLIQLNDQVQTLDLLAYSSKDLIKIYKSKKRSYKNIPFRLAQINNFYFPEKLKTNIPLLDQICCQADLGITICTKEILKTELNQQISKIINLMKFFGLEDFKLELALRGPLDQEYYGNQKEWYKLQNILIESVKSLGLVVYEAVNTAQKEGPGYNLVYEDIKNKKWKLATVFIDIEKSHTENIKYADSTGKDKDAYIITKSFCLSVERIMGLIIEKYQGAFPIWLSPVHVNLIPISKKYNTYARELYFQLIQQGISATIDLSAATMQNKIKKSQEKLIPYMLIIGQKEMQNSTVSVRPRSDQDLGMMKLDEFVGIIKQELRNYQTF